MSNRKKLSTAKMPSVRRDGKVAVRVKFMIKPEVYRAWMSDCEELDKNPARTLAQRLTELYLHGKG